MTPDFHHSLEPFPLFIDSAPPNSANYFSSPMAMAAIQLLATAGTSSSSAFSSKENGSRKPRVSMSIRASNYLRMRYYQYEVTFGLYMLTSREKVIFNTILLVTFSAILYALMWGFQPFIINCICKLLYYITGSVSSAPKLCS